jgi:hypothetical protein
MISQNGPPAELSLVLALDRPLALLLQCPGIEACHEITSGVLKSHITSLESHITSIIILIFHNMDKPSRKQISLA